MTNETPTTWTSLRDAFYSVRSRAASALGELQGVERTAKTLTGSAGSAINLLERMPALIAALDAVQDKNDFTIRNEMAGIYAKFEGLLSEMSRLQSFCLKTVEKHDRVLTPLRDEAIALLGIAEIIEKAGDALPQKTADLNARIREFNTAAENSFVGVLDSGLQARRLELESLIKSQEQESRLTGTAQLARIELTPITEQLTALDRRAQLQRGTWQLIGEDLKTAAGLLGSGVEGRVKWALSRTYAPTQLRMIRQVGERAAKYVVTSDPL